MEADIFTPWRQSFDASILFAWRLLVFSCGVFLAPKRRNGTIQPLYISTKRINGRFSILGWDYMYKNPFGSFVENRYFSSPEPKAPGELIV